MNKSELIDAIAAESKLTKADARRSLDAFMSVVGKTLKAGEKITLVGFGSFSVVKRASRMGRNPRTGAPIKIAAKKVVKFSPGANLSTKVNKGK